MRKFIWVGLAVLALVLSSVAPAKADTCSNGVFASSGGTVQLTNSNTAGFTITVNVQCATTSTTTTLTVWLVSASYLGNPLAGTGLDDFAFNLNQTPTVSGNTVAWSFQNNATADGFGRFLRTGHGPANTSGVSLPTALVFTFQGNNLSFVSSSSFPSPQGGQDPCISAGTCLSPPKTSASFVVHVRLNNPATGGTCSTWAGDTAISQEDVSKGAGCGGRKVPEPGTLSLLIPALIGVLGFARRRWLVA